MSQPTGPRSPDSGRPDPSGASHPSSRRIDAWSIMSYLLSGMVVWGGAGWLLDRWLHTSFLVVIGLVLGTVLAYVLIWARLKQ